MKQGKCEKVNIFKLNSTLCEMQVFLWLIVKDGWQFICWAFLKPGDGKSFSNINQRCCLQLYEYQENKWFRRQTHNTYSVFDQWKLPKKIK